MTIIDADKFLAYLIFSKHIDGLNCGEVKKEIEMCKVDVLDKIRAEIDKLPRIKVGNSNSPTVKYCIDENLIYDLLEHYEGKVSGE